MKYLIIFSHFNDKSFNSAIRKTIEHALKENNQEVKTRDLHQLKFNPVLSKEDYLGVRSGKPSKDVLKEQEEIKWADILIFVYPIWWSGMPAILKGYIDRVFSYGFAYEYQEDRIIKKLSDKKVVIVNTHGASKEDYEKNGMYGAMTKTTDQGIFGFCGMRVIDHIYLGSVDDADDSERENMLKDIKKSVNKWV